MYDEAHLRVTCIDKLPAFWYSVVLLILAISKKKILLIL